MGKKTKRSRRSGGGGSAAADGSASGSNDNTAHRQKATDDDDDAKVNDDAIVSESDISHQPNQSHKAGELEEDRRRLPPALRNTTGNDHEKDVDEMNEEDDEYEDMYEEEDDEDSYEDVYESSGDEDEDGVYEESMLLDNDGVGDADAGAGAGAAPIQKKLPPININDGSNPPPAKIKTWNPFLGRSNNNGDGAGGGELEMDETAYKMHHALTPEWPSLTLDIIPDKHFGEHRTRFPHVVTMVVGSSQSENSNKNKIDVLRMSDLCRMPGSGREKTEKELDDEMLGEEWKHEDEDDGEESDDDDDDEEEEDASASALSSNRRC